MLISSSIRAHVEVISREIEQIVVIRQTGAQGSRDGTSESSIAQEQGRANRRPFEGDGRDGTSSGVIADAQISDGHWERARDRTSDSIVVDDDGEEITHGIGRDGTSEARVASKVEILEVRVCVVSGQRTGHLSVIGDGKLSKTRQGSQDVARDGTSAGEVVVGDGID